MYQIEHLHGLTKRAKEHGDVLNLNLNDGLAIELVSFYTVRGGIVVVNRVCIKVSIKVAFQDALDYIF